jgi:hypothetical protein
MNNIQARRAQELLNDYKQSRIDHSMGEKLIFSGVGDRDVYNITAPFEDRGEMIIAGRVERRNSVISEVVFFRQDGERWIAKENTIARTQDPFFTKVNGELVLGGVEIMTDPDDPERIISWVTRFYKGKDIDSLEPFTTGPERMKDIRVVELPDGSIGVFTRPQGEIGGMGQIGFIKLPSLDELNEENILKAHIFKDQIVPEEWGGANEPHLLKNGLIGVLGHIACMDHERKKHYYSMVFTLNPETKEKTPIKIIADRSSFPEGPAKRPDLVDILFSGGLVRLDNGKAKLYTGVSDTEAHVLTIDDPFLEYESL